MLKSLKSKIILPVIAVLALLITVTFLFVSRSTTNLADTLIAERMTGLSQAAEAYIEKLEAEQGLLARAFAGSPELVEFLRDWNGGGDRVRIRQELMLYFTDTKHEFEISFIVVTDSNDEVILRTHAFERYGDTGLVSPAIEAASQEGDVSSVYSSTAEFTLGRSAAAPILDGIDNIIGTISVGTGMYTSEFVDEIAGKFNAEVIIFLDDKSVATTILNEHGERDIGVYADDEIIEGVFVQGQSMTTMKYIHDVPHRAYVRPLIGWFDNPIGMFFIGFSDEYAIAATSEMQRTLIIIGVVGVLFAAALIALMLLKLLKPLFSNLEEAVNREQYANQAKTRFLTRMSHEIRTPMNTIIGITEIQLQKDTHPAETEDALMRIRTSSNLLLALINDILDLSKVEAGKMEIVPLAYETASMVIDTVQLNLIYIGSKVIKFKLSVDENLPVYLIGDELRIKQILNNILSNAFKYTLEGSVSLSISVDSKVGDDVVILMEICDTGQGMTAEQIANLWGEFSRFNVQENYLIEGTGLGLSIAYQLTTMMNGELAAESVLGVGSKFTLRLPQKASGTDTLGAETVKSMQNLDAAQKSLRRLAKLEREPMPYGRVLVVDDVESNLYVAKGFLIPYKLAVDTVDSGILAIEKVKDGEIYDIIFMDHMMPDMDGVEATKTLREMGYTHPIIALTANAFVDIAEMFLNSGFTDYASKPIDINQMDKHLMQYIYGKQPQEVIEQARAAKAYLQLEENNRLSDILVKSFLRDAKKAVDILATLDIENSNDIKTYILQIHAMRSALNNIGRKELSNLASKLEQAGRRDDIQLINEKTPELIERLSEIINELENREEPKNKKEDENTDTEESVKFLRNRMQFIYDACDFLDIDGAKEAIAELSQMNYSNQVKKLLDEIYDLLMNSNFDEAGKLAFRNASLAK